jgi:hypothetical protein
MRRKKRAQFRNVQRTKTSCALTFIIRGWLYEGKAVNYVRGRGGIAASILNLGARWRWVVRFTLRPLYSRGKSPQFQLDGSQCRSGKCEKKNISYSCWESSADSSVVQPHGPTVSVAASFSLVKVTVLPIFCCVPVTEIYNLLKFRVGLVQWTSERST